MDEFGRALPPGQHAHRRERSPPPRPRTYSAGAEHVTPGGSQARWQHSAPQSSGTDRHTRDHHRRYEDEGGWRHSREDRSEQHRGGSGVRQSDSRYREGNVSRRRGGYDAGERGWEGGPRQRGDGERGWEGGPRQRGDGERGWEGGPRQRGDGERGWEGGRRWSREKGREFREDEEEALPSARHSGVVSSVLRQGCLQDGVCHADVHAVWRGVPGFRVATLHEGSGPSMPPFAVLSFSDADMAMRALSAALQPGSQLHEAARRLQVPGNRALRITPHKPEDGDVPAAKTSVGRANSIPAKFDPQAQAPYVFDSTTGMFWDGQRGWFACPRGRTVYYLHHASQQLCTFNGIDFVPFTPPPPSEQPPAVVLQAGTPGSDALPLADPTGTQRELRCKGSGFIVQRKRGVLLCALCRRRFRRADTLKDHLLTSPLHAANVKLVKNFAIKAGEAGAAPSAGV